MKDSQVVIALANMASKVDVKVTMDSMGKVHQQWEELYKRAAELINKLEAQEKEGINDPE